MRPKWSPFPVAKKPQDLVIWPVPPFRAVFPDLAPYRRVVVALDVVLETVALDVVLETVALDVVLGVAADVLDVAIVVWSVEFTDSTLLS
jgi:hypothetical protein